MQNRMMPVRVVPSLSAAAVSRARTSSSRRIGIVRLLAILNQRYAMQKKSKDFCCVAYHWYAIVSAMIVKRKTRTIPIRMDDYTKGRIDRAALRMASNRTAVIRLAILQILPEIEAGNKL